VLDVSLQLKRKPGQSDVDRTLGSVEQKYRKLKTTDTPAAESQVSLTIEPIINLTGSFEWQSAEEFFFLSKTSNLIYIHRKDTTCLY
jgi:hypothetical protein